jgi:hypothetical protein
MMMTMRTTSHKLDEEDNLDEDDKLDLAQIENPLVVCEWEIDIATVDSVEDSNTTRANTTRVRRRPDIQVTVNIHKQTELPVHPTTTKEIVNAFLKMLRYSIGGNPQARKLVRDLIEEVLPILPSGSASWRNLLQRRGYFSTNFEGRMRYLLD